MGDNRGGLPQHQPGKHGRCARRIPGIVGAGGHQAVQAAREAFPAWRKLSRINRGEFIDAFAQLAKSRTELLARLLARESARA
ncbi:MAG: aldehyde dehydrogenase family protein [Chloroflexi bacterium]|nr:aldehyde dehydrogenase family protein [Chloroflexota bacterium]